MVTGLEILLMVSVPIIATWVGFVEVRLSKMMQKPDRSEVENLVDMYQEPMEVMQKELKEDIRRLEQKLDKMIDKLL